ADAADRLLAAGTSGADVVRALDRHGFADVAEAIVGMQRQRISADYLQTSAVIDAAGTVHSAVNDPNRYSGPGTGYRLEGERWQTLQSLPYVVDPRELVEEGDAAAPILVETGEAAAGERADEVVVAVGPAFGDGLCATINGLPHADVLAAICDGIREEGAEPRVVP